MRTLLIFTIALISTSSACLAQCPGKVTWNASKAEFLDKDGKVMQTMPDKILVVTTKTDILLRHDEEGNDDMKGSIKDMVCTWKEPFKNGKTVFKTDLVDASGDIKPAQVTIEGIDGKIVIMVEGLGGDKRIRISVESFLQDDGSSTSNK